MDSSNRYAAPPPDPALHDSARGPLTVGRGFAIVLASGAGFAVGGAAVGLALATLLPGYYRGVLPSGNAPGFNPVQVGLGLGASQGLGTGLVIGCVVVLAVAIANFRRR